MIVYPCSRRLVLNQVRVIDVLSSQGSVFILFIHTRCYRGASPVLCLIFAFGTHLFQHITRAYHYLLFPMVGKLFHSFRRWKVFRWAPLVSMSLTSHQPSRYQLGVGMDITCMALITFGSHHLILRGSNDVSAWHLHLKIQGMGQILSYIKGLLKVPPLLNLPTEILLLIASHLSSSPESLVALSLTCKALSSIFERDAVTLCEKSRRQLLLLLEKDLGSRFFYCSVCCQLHHFSQQWSPTTASHLYMPNNSCISYHYNKLFLPTPASYKFPVTRPYQLYVFYHRTCLASAT